MENKRQLITFKTQLPPGRVLSVGDSLEHIGIKGEVISILKVEILDGEAVNIVGAYMDPEKRLANG